jgi:hypothetical protein
MGNCGKPPQKICGTLPAKNVSELNWWSLSWEIWQKPFPGGGGNEHIETSPATLFCRQTRQRAKTWPHEDQCR